MRGALALALVALAAGPAAAVSDPATAVAPLRAAAGCARPALGFAGPLTGQAAFLGQEQVSWARFAVSQYNRRYGTSFKVVQGDTQLSASRARAVGREFVANEEILGVIGPSTSPAVISSAGLFRLARLAAVSASAARTDLTTGGKFPTFFRVVPNDFAQAPSIVDFAITSLQARRAVVIDSQTDYSLALANGVAYRFRLKGVTVERESVAATARDFSSIAGSVAGNVEVVVFATQAPSAAQRLSVELRALGKRAVVLGTDGAYMPAQFKPKLGYVSSFAPDLRLVPGGAAIVGAYNTFSRSKSFGLFGPPTYMAAWVLMDAIRTACRDGIATRAEVTAHVRRTNVPSILGGSVRFTKKGDLVGARFHVFKITNGRYTLAGQGA